MLTGSVPVRVKAVLLCVLAAFVCALAALVAPGASSLGPSALSSSAVGPAARAAAGPVAASRPTVAGTLAVDGKLTGNPGTWVGTGTIDYAYQWYRCNPLGARCSSVHGATRATYTEVPADARRALGLSVTATDSTGATTAYASLVGVVAPRGAALEATAQPPLTGDPIVGAPLRVEPPTWSTPAGTTSSAWLRCNANARLCTPIAGATAATYVVTAADVGHTLIDAVTGTRGRTRQTVLSIASGLARTTPGPVVAGRPAITGTLQQGGQLAANAGTWSGSGTIVYAYQWYRCDANGAHCASVRGATRQTYVQVSADVGKTVALTVKATDATGTTTAYSSLAGIVAAGTSTFAVKAQPSLAGTPVAGQQLKVSGGTFTATPRSATYAWLRCNQNGRLCTAIAGASADTYTVVAADAGHALVAAVTASAGTATQVALTTLAAVPA